MKDVTIKAAVENIHTCAVELGMDVSPTDIAWIISTFVETIMMPMMPNQASSDFMQIVADEIQRIRDE